MLYCLVEGERSLVLQVPEDRPDRPTNKNTGHGSISSCKYCRIPVLLILRALASGIGISQSYLALVSANNFPRAATSLDAASSKVSNSGGSNPSA